jgi:hypothetical protein
MCGNETDGAPVRRGEVFQKVPWLVRIVSATTIAYFCAWSELQVAKISAVSEFLRKEAAASERFESTQANLTYSQGFSPCQENPDEQSKQNFTYLTYYAYSEVPPTQKPADTVLESLKDIPIGTPIEEIKRAADAFGLDFTFMKAVAKIESGFDPNQRTGSYIGLYQLSNYEFDHYGSGSITNPRDNAIAAAYKFMTEGILFELHTHKQPTRSDRYLIHQQGTQGAAEHLMHPERIAWQSMCATVEGKEKGESWCKRAIWKNTLPEVKEIWKSVENLTSAGFVDMWQQRLDVLYTRYAVDTAPLPAVALTVAVPSTAPSPPMSPPSSNPAEKQSKPVVHVAAFARHHKLAAHSFSRARRSFGQRGLHRASRDTFAQVC